MSIAAAALAAGPLVISCASAVSAEPANANDAARLFAGIAPAADSPLAALTQDPSWQRHAKYFDAIFGALDRRQFARIRTWSQANLATHQPVALYMFSGPDFLYADAFFGDASTIVLSALEPVGQIPDAANLRPAALSRTLGNIEAALKSLLTISFFRTKDMKTQLAGGGGGVNGVLPVLYVFLARTGKVIHDVELVNLDAQGNPIPAEPRAKTGARGVKIDYASADGRMHTLYYFETNLDNNGVRTSGFLSFCEKLGPADSFIKSASYLLHQGGFTVLRDFILKRGGMVLQDDSGIPLSHFDRDKWQLQPFGRYVGPIEIFAQYYQAQLVRLFREGGPMPIDFGIGYRWRPNESNLLLAQGRAR